MKLNGWQRLWVVAVVVWILPVLAISYELWPSTTGIPNAEVYMGMKPEDGRRLIDYDTAERWQVASPTSKDAFEQLAAEDTAKSQGQIAEIGGHRVQFSLGVSQQDMDQTAKAYAASLRHILALKKAAFAGEAAAWWMVPAIALYGLGWAVGWIRRGFGANRLGRAG